MSTLLLLELGMCVLSASVMCGLCDFRYDIDSKSPDLAKHVSEELQFLSLIWVRTSLALNLFPLLSLHVSDVLGSVQTKVCGIKTLKYILD